MKKTNEASKLVGVSKRTLQYYDDEKVFSVKRSKNNYRLYDQDALEKIWHILIYKEMGFDLSQIKQLLSAPHDTREEQFRLRVKCIEAEKERLNEMSNFISFIATNGIPQAPSEKDAITYVNGITQLKEEIKKRNCSKSFKKKRGRSILCYGKKETWDKEEKEDDML